MLLAIDIGNTNIRVGVFDGQELRASWRFSTNMDRLADEYAALLSDLLPYDGLNIHDINHAIIASVVSPLVDVFKELCWHYFKVSPLVIEAGIKTGVNILLDNPRELGADRVANAVAAHQLYGGPLIVIDFGTATTFDVVSSKGDYLGGAIAPGIGIAANALFKNTSRLPQVELIRPKKAISKNTVAAIQSGIIFGYEALIEGIIARMNNELGEKAKVIATGGLLRTIVKETKVIDIINPDLTLTGLRIIYELNE